MSLEQLIKLYSQNRYLLRILLLLLMALVCASQKKITSDTLQLIDDNRDDNRGNNC